LSGPVREGRGFNLDDVGTIIGKKSSKFGSDDNDTEVQYAKSIER
jgi:hypothetical protein